jgi:hypothetical protein
LLPFGEFEFELVAGGALEVVLCVLLEVVDSDVVCVEGSVLVEDELVVELGGTVVPLD